MNKKQLLIKGVNMDKELMKKIENDISNDYRIKEIDYMIANYGTHSRGEIYRLLREIDMDSRDLIYQLMECNTQPQFKRFLNDLIDIISETIRDNQ